MSNDPHCAWYVTCGSIAYTIGAIFAGLLVYGAIMRDYEIDPPEYDIDTADEAIAKVRASHLTMFSFAIYFLSKVYNCCFNRT